MKLKTAELEVGVSGRPDHKGEYYIVVMKGALGFNFGWKTHYVKPEDLHTAIDQYMTEVKSWEA